MVGAAGPVAARHSKLCLPLLFVSVVIVRVPDRGHGQLRRADARCPRSALPADRHTAVRRCGERITCLRLGLTVRVPAGLARQDTDPQGEPAGLGRPYALCRTGGAGDSLAADPWLDRKSTRLKSR